MRTGFLINAARKGAGAAVAVAIAAGVVAGCTEEKPKTLEPVTRYTQLPAKKVPPYLKDTIYERTQMMRNEGFAVSGYGLVAGLDGTGESTAPTAVREYIIKE